MLMIYPLWLAAQQTSGAIFLIWGESHIHSLTQFMEPAMMWWNPFTPGLSMCPIWVGPTVKFLAERQIWGFEWWATSEPGIPIKISNVIPYETKSYDHKSCFLVQQQALILGRWMVHIILINQIQKTTPYNHTNRIRIGHSFLIFSSFFSAELITFLAVYCSLM